MMEKYSCYEFEIRCHDVPGWGEFVNQWVKGYFYIIFDPACKDRMIVEANEYFDSEQQARLAAIGHITLLENGGETC